MNSKIENIYFSKSNREHCPYTIIRNFKQGSKWPAVLIAKRKLRYHKLKLESIPKDWLPYQIGFVIKPTT